MPANDKQVAGNHYRKYGKMQHWDVVAHFGLDYFQGQITRYLFRWKDKNGLEDLLKAGHYMEKYKELNGWVPEEITLADLSRNYNRVVEIQGKFVWEGSKEGTVMFTCKTCRGKVHAKNVIDAYVTHRCSRGVEPTPDYVDQAKD